MKLSKLTKKLLFILALFSLLLITTGLCIQKSKDNYSKKQTKLYVSAKKYCNSLYQNNDLPKTNTSIKKINKCKTLLYKVDNKETVKSLIDRSDKTIQYININNEIKSIYDNDTFNRIVKEEDISNINNKISTLNGNQKKDCETKLNDLKKEYNNNENAKKLVVSLFSDYDNLIVNENVSRENYNNALNTCNNLKQSSLKDELTNNLNVVLDLIQKKEAAERKRLEEERKRREEEKRKRDEAIKKAWIILNVPYISQNENGVLNGCEAASLLMALKYKGYLQNMNLYDYATNMPKSDDPNTGFYLDIYGIEPTNISHWIAPEPLKNYGISSSGNPNIVNITSASLDQLDQEIKNNNPVIIYLTSKFTTPVNYSNGVPKNLHVQLLIGYNEITKEQLILDPWKYQTLSSYWFRSYNEINNIYQKVGSRAVVVR